MMRYCERFFCDTIGERICCHDCKRYQEGVCSNHCLNDPAKCRLVTNAPKLKYKAVRQYGLSGQLITEYPSVMEAAATLGIGATSIRTSIKRGGRCGGYIFRYTEDDHA